ncbi:hypothetical protein CTEN210_00417 [Chaetoceros tenuissimus]|uniref:RING-type E3 ubiquitin transferase n=1 Tax=Chaetoceros tenuissimus TaxID=426638 RepID=A0AAD3CDS3_9STRA|nr:hypothetical protein CTEN210_00417 [Chaetoceros tenuissimus]
MEDLQTDHRFSCNICFEQVREPVCTRCGHLYCWPCLYSWLRPGMNAEDRRHLQIGNMNASPNLDTGRRICPVCKDFCSVSTVIPIYVREEEHEEDESKVDTNVKPEPNAREDMLKEVKEDDENVFADDVEDIDDIADDDENCSIQSDGPSGDSGDYVHIPPAVDNNSSFPNISSEGLRRRFTAGHRSMSAPVGLSGNEAQESNSQIPTRPQPQRTVVEETAPQNGNIGLNRNDQVLRQLQEIMYSMRNEHDNFHGNTAYTNAHSDHVSRNDVMGGIPSLHNARRNGQVEDVEFEQTPYRAQGNFEAMLDLTSRIFLMLIFFILFAALLIY